ncbi:hypothetical protein JXA40_03570 [bacterium]|nr:hypothetical protein [candidate division CSSED10-310 bacterium]
MSRSVIEMIILMSLSVLIGLLANVVSPVGIPLFGNWDPAEGILHAGGPCAPRTSEISDEEILTAYIDPANILFVDARPEQDYIASHISRAISFPLEQFEEYLPDFLARYPTGKQIVIYCSGIGCTDSHELSKNLEPFGYQNVRIYSAGYEGWVAAGRPVKGGVEP